MEFQAESRSAGSAKEQAGGPELVHALDGVRGIAVLLVVCTNVSPFDTYRLLPGRAAALFFKPRLDWRPALLRTVRL